MLIVGLPNTTTSNKIPMVSDIIILQTGGPVVVSVSGSIVPSFLIIDTNSELFSSNSNWLPLHLF